MIEVISLGCFRNTVDSENILSRLKEKGVKISSGKKRFVFINTCGFVEDAKKESIDAIIDCIQAKKKKKIDKIIVGGCLAKRYPKELLKNFKEIDAIVGLEASFCLS
jgi:ribosomal protein S12 methylthiotransferase